MKITKKEKAPKLITKESDNESDSYCEGCLFDSVGKCDLFDANVIGFSCEDDDVDFIYVLEESQ